MSNQEIPPIVPRESRTYNNENTLASINYTGAAIGNLSYTWDANLTKPPNQSAA